MKIFISHQDKRLGPYSLEEARSLIDRGMVVRSDLAWQDGDANSVPLHNFLQTLPPVDSAPHGAAQPVAGDALNRLRDPLENTALNWLCVASVPIWLLLLFWVMITLGLVLIPLFLLWLALHLTKHWFAVHLRTNALRVSETQLPDLHRAVQHCATRLGIEPPAVYVLPATHWNACVAKFADHQSVFLLSNAVPPPASKVDPLQLAWLIGHQLGRRPAGRLEAKRQIARLGGWAFWLYLWHARRGELTGDRTGLFCSGSLSASQCALLHATLGNQLADQVNVSEAVAQWNGHREEFLGKYRTLCSAHPQLRARLEQLAAAAQEFGLPTTPTS